MDTRYEFKPKGKKRIDVSVKIFLAYLCASFPFTTLILNLAYRQLTNNIEEWVIQARMDTPLVIAEYCTCNCFSKSKKKEIFKLQGAGVEPCSPALQTSVLTTSERAGWGKLKFQKIKFYPYYFIRAHRVG